MDVRLKECPHCGGGNLGRCKRHEDHYQEDIVIPQAKVTRFRHHYYYCPDCKEVVHGVGEGEMPGSYIGPVAKSVAGWLHYKLNIPYRKEGENHWLWCFAAPGAVIYKIDRSRGSKVVESVLGKEYDGVLISDFLKTYNPIKSLKQKCLVHLPRLIKKRQVYFADDRKRSRYFAELKKLIKKIIALSNKMSKRLPRNFIDRRADLTARLRRKLQQTVDHPKADKFLKTLSDNFDELVTCLDFKEVCAHNNWAERLLRGNVIMRKITFGNRSDNGIRNHEVIMSLIETARLKNLDGPHFLRLLLTNPTVANAVILHADTSSG